MSRRNLLTIPRVVYFYDKFCKEANSLSRSVRFVLLQVERTETGILFKEAEQDVHMRS